MGMDQNHNKAIIGRIARKSMANNRARNFFTCLTIALSVALVLTFILYIFGSSKEKLRQQEDSAQVTYMDIAPGRMKELKADSRIRWAAAEKNVGSSKVGRNRVGVSYQDAYFMERDRVQYTGELPKEENEIMIPRDYLEQLGIKAEPGDSISLDLGDKVTREYQISGIVDNPPKASNNYRIYVSLPGAMMMKGQDKETVDAVVDMKGAADMDYDAAQQRAWDIAEDLGITQEQTKINDGYFSQANVSKLTTGSIITLAMVALLILAAAGIVIHNIFYIAVAGKVREYGQMRTIGMTRKQVRTLVSREGVLLALRGAPFGLVLGGVMGYALVPGGWSFLTFFGASAVCLVLGLAAVGLSVRKPAKIAASTSPIEALGYTGYTEKARESGALKRKLTPAGLAALNLKRNRKKSILTMCSLILAGVLLGTITSFIVSFDPGAPVDTFFPNGEYQLELTAESGYGNSDTSLDGRAKMYASLQAEGIMGKDFKEELEQIDGVKSAHSWKYLMIIADLFEKEQEMGINGFTKEDFKLLQEMNYQGPKTYEELLNEPGLIVETEADSNFKDYPVKPGDEIAVTFYNGNGQRIETTLPVLATIKEISWSSKNLEENREVKLPISIMGSTLLMPEKMLDQWTMMNTAYGYEIACEPGKEKAVGQSLDERFGADENMFLSSKQERREFLEREFFAMIVILYVLAGFLVVFGVINLLNTIMTNLYSRKKELGIMQAVGMTRAQVSAMLSRETLNYVGMSAICTVVLGGALGYALVRVLTQAGLAVNYSYPWLPVLVYIIVLMILQWALTQFGVKMLQRESLVERMKETE